MSWKEAKVEPSPGLFPVSEAEIKRTGPDLKDLYLAVSSVAGQTHLQNSFSSPSLSAILVNPQPLVNPTLERKLPFTIPSSASFPKMPFLSDNSSIPRQPSPQNLSSQRKQIYDNPGICRREQPSSTTSHESQALMPPPPPPRDLSKPPPGVSLESQLMPPPKVIPGDPGRAGHGSVELLSSPDSMRISSRYPGSGSSQHKEDIGKRDSNHSETIRPTWLAGLAFAEMNLLHFWRNINHLMMMVFPSDVCFCIRLQ